MADVEVKLFGTVRVKLEHGNRDLDIAPSVQLLLSYLLLHREAIHPRERLVDILWRDVAPSLGRSRLSTTMWRLRRQLNENCGSGLFLSTAAGHLRLNDGADLWLDVAEFEEAALRFLRTSVAEICDTTVAGIERGLALFTQELMEGHYCDWVLDERNRLNDLKERCLSRLIEVYTAHGRDEETIARGLDLLALDPLREDAHRAVMAAQLHLGRPHLAKRQYDRCRDLLSRELGIEPVTETRALSERLICAEESETLTGTLRSEIVALRIAISAAEDQLRDITRRIDALLSR